MEYNKSPGQSSQTDRLAIINATEMQEVWKIMSREEDYMLGIKVDRPR